MAEHDWLGERFEANRTHLRAVAYRMLGSLSEADDAVQEAWLRLSRSDTSGVANLGGWLTTVVGRGCLDMLRARASQREEALDAQVLEPIAGRAEQGKGAPRLAPETRGAAAVAETFSGRAQAAQPALVDGVAGAVWASGGEPRAVFGFAVGGGRIVAIEILAEPARLHRLDLTILDG